MKSSQDIGELASALAKAQGQLLGATKDKKNPFFKSKYADLESCWASCREQLSENNISVVQMTSAGSEGEIVINTILMHESGQWIEGELPLKPVKDDPQGIGSAITYGRRYALMGAVGIAPADDDGEASMGRGKNNVQSLLERIKTLSSPDQFLLVKREISKINSDKERKRIGAIFNDKMRSQGISYNQSKESFSIKDLDWYETEAERQGDVVTWWKNEHPQALKLLSKTEISKMESFVSQLFDIKNAEGEAHK